MNIFISPEAAQRKRILTLKNTKKNTNNNYYHLKELLKKTRNGEKNKITAPVTVTLPVTVHKSTDQADQKNSAVLVAY